MLFWTLLPDQMLPLVFVAGGLIFLLGWRSAGVGLVGTVLAMPLLAPVVEAVIAALPPWITLAILAVVAFSLFRAAAALLLGRGAADYIVGRFAFEAARFALTVLVVWPFRAAWKLLRALFRYPGPRELHLQEPLPGRLAMHNRKTVRQRRR